MDNTFTNDIVQMNAFKTLAVDKNIEVDIGTGMNKSMEVDEGTEVDENTEVDNGIKIDYTELKFDSYKAIRDTTNIVDYTNSENFCKVN
ncbi:8045_t:CDS:2 [Racocetra fulgida]|uniref:8045_t:CDS:1 n=1 Tax=Racocetra fulgida TaxID=60492 RepID=A0A9N9FI66_9GLOM|nr:8045_t:CDS:2 [Racocetra fulgida]